MTRASLALATALVALPMSAATQVNDILVKTRQVLGVSTPLKALSLTGVRRVPVQTPDGPSSMSRDSELHFLLPDKFQRSEQLELPNGMSGPTILQTLDGDSSWTDTQNAPTGANIFIRTRPAPEPGQQGLTEEQARTRSLRTSFLRNLLMYTLTPPPGIDVKFEYVGEAESPDGKLWMLDAKGPDRFEMRLFIDQKTNVPVMASWRGLQVAPQAMRTVRMMPGAPKPKPGEMPEGMPEPPKPKEVDFEAHFTEYTKYGGVLLPKTLTLTAEGKTTEEFELKSAKVNPNLKPEKFRK